MEKTKNFCCKTEVGLYRNDASINMQLFENDEIFKLPVRISFQDAGKDIEQQITFRLATKIAEVMEGGK